MILYFITDGLDVDDIYTASPRVQALLSFGIKADQVRSRQKFMLHCKSLT